MAMHGWIASIATWVALLALVSQSSLITIGRTIAPYYPLLLLPAFYLFDLFSTNRRKLWSIGVALFLGCCLVSLVLHPPRPLWPAITTLKLVSGSVSSANLTRALEVYAFYRDRPSAFKPLRDILDATHADIVYFISTGDEPIATLMWHSGNRNIQEITPHSEQQLSLPAAGSILVFSQRSLRLATGKSMEEWLNDNPVEVIGSKTLKVKVQRGLEEWYVARVLKANPIK
jgi:hypothetical protein